MDKIKQEFEEIKKKHLEELSAVENDLQEELMKQRKVSNIEKDIIEQQSNKL